MHVWGVAERCVKRVYVHARARPPCRR